MSRVTVGLAFAAALTFALQPTGALVGALDKLGDGEPTTISASVGLQAFYDHGDLGRDWPCPDVVIDGELVGQTRNSMAVEDTGILSGAVRERERVVDGRTQKRWVSFCRPNVPGHSSTDITLFWVAVPIPAELVPAVYAEAIELLAAPLPQWQFVDEFDWLYVHTPMTLRVTNLAPVTASATVSNIFGSASATVSARPVELVFTSEAPDTPSVSCSIDELRQSYVPGEGCTVQYGHSSAITADDHFGYTLTVRWEVESTPPRPDLGSTIETSYSDRIQVAEVQAVVTCQGSGC